MKKIVSFCLLFGLMLGINSCQKDEFRNEIDAHLKSDEIGKKEIIDEALGWFENNTEQNQYKLLESAKELKWENAVINDLDSILVVEVPIKLKDNYKVCVIDSFNLNIEHRLLIFKEKDAMYSLMEYFISEKDLEYLQDVEKIKYSKIESDFEGVIVLVDACDEVISTEWVTKKLKSAELRLKSVSGYCVWLVWKYADGTIENIMPIYCVYAEDSQPGGGSGGGGDVGSEPGEDANSLPEVYVIDLEQNVKAKCIYDKLINGTI